MKILRNLWISIPVIFFAILILLSKPVPKLKVRSNCQPQLDEARLCTYLINPFFESTLSSSSLSSLVSNWAAAAVPIAQALWQTLQHWLSPNPKEIELKITGESDSCKLDASRTDVLTMTVHCTFLAHKSYFVSFEPWFQGRSGKLFAVKIPVAAELSPAQTKTNSLAQSTPLPPTPSLFSSSTSSVPHKPQATLPLGAEASISSQLAITPEESSNHLSSSSNSAPMHEPLASSPPSPRSHVDSQLHLKESAMFGVVHTFFCFPAGIGGLRQQNNFIPASTRDLLLRSPLKKYISVSAGTLQAGTSHMNNELANYIMKMAPDDAVAQASAQGLIKLPIDRFATSASDKFQSKCIKFMVLPRFRDGHIVPNECYIIIDVDGLDLGNPNNPRIMLNIVSRLGSCLTFVARDSFDDRIFAHLGELLGTNSLRNRDEISAYSSIPLPDIVIAVSKYSNKPFNSEKAAMLFLRAKLERTSGCQYIPERKLLHQWLSRQKLGLFTIPIDNNLLAEAPHPVAPDTAAATRSWIESVLQRVVPFPLHNTHQDFIDFCDFLLRDYPPFNLGNM